MRRYAILGVTDRAMMPAKPLRCTSLLLAALVTVAEAPPALPRQPSPQPKPAVAPAPKRNDMSNVPQRRPELGATALLDAARRGQTAAVKRLIAGGVNVGARDEDGNAALALAAAAGKVETVRFLLSAQA